MRDKLLKGVMPAVLVPLNQDGTVHYGLLREHVNYLLANKVDVLYLFGSTTDGAYFHLEEKIAVTQVINELVQVSDHAPCICYVIIQPSTEEAYAELETIEKYDLSIDYYSATTPFYYSCPQNVIFEHYQVLSTRASKPFIAYDIPSCTHNKIAFETMLKLARLDNCIGMKDSSGDMSKFLRAMRKTLALDFSWIQGDDALHMASLLSGANGFVTGGGNIKIEPYVQLYDAYLANDKVGMREAQITIDSFSDLYSAVGGKINPTIRYCTSLQKRCTPYMKMHSMQLSENEIGIINSLF